MSAEPGWYPDPSGADIPTADGDAWSTGRRPQQMYRWWDGTRWTDAIGESAHAHPPWLLRQSEVSGRPPGAVGRTALRLSAGVVLVTVLGVLAGLVIWREPALVAPNHSAGVGPADWPLGATSAQSGPAGRLEKGTRQATVGSASMTLPDDPYEVYPDALRLPGLMSEFFQATAVVHERFDGHRDWAAVVGLAHVKVTPSQATDLEKCGTAALNQLAKRFFGGHPTTVRRLRSSDHAVDGRPGVQITARVHYRIGGLPSRYDVVTAYLVRQDDGSVIAAFSSVANDAPHELTRLAEESLASLRVE